MPSPLRGKLPVPGNEILLIIHFGFGAHLSAGDLKNKVENLLTNLLDARSAGNNRTSVEVDDIGHALRELRVG